MGLHYDSVVAWVQANVASSPGAVAVEYSGLSLSYAELASRADAVAEGLHAAGVLPGQVVGVMVEEPVARIASLLGVMQMGGIVTPFTPEEPHARLRAMVAQVEPVLWLTEHAGLETVTAVVEVEAPRRLILVDEGIRPASLPGTWQVQQLGETCGSTLLSI